MNLRITNLVMEADWNCMTQYIGCMIHNWEIWTNRRIWGSKHRLVPICNREQQFHPV